MKKLVAILVALLMLVASVASAESAYVISDPVVSVTSSETMNLDLTGLTIRVASGEVDGVIALQIDVLGNGEKLMGAAANILGTEVAFQIEGTSNAYVVALPQQAQQAMQLDISSLNIDLEALMTAVSTGIEFDGENFKVPYTTVNDVLEILAPALANIEIPGVDMSELTSGIAQLKESNSGLDIAGSYKEDGSNVNFNMDIIPVQNGEQADQKINVAFVADDSQVSFTLDAAGQATMYFKAAPVDDKVTLKLGGSADGQAFDLTCTVGMEDADVTFTAIDVANALNVEQLTDEQMQQLQSEASNAATGVLGFVFTALSAAA